LSQLRALLLARLDGVQASGRWTPERKEALVLLLRNALISYAEAQAQYGVSAEELREWAARLRRYGKKGLAARQFQATGPTP
jgi:transposase-like protein